MRCPKCGANGAYIGFQTVECPNPGCSSFLAVATTEFRPEEQTDIKKCRNCADKNCKIRRALYRP